MIEYGFQSTCNRNYEVMIIIESKEPFQGNIVYCGIFLKDSLNRTTSICRLVSSSACEKKNSIFLDVPPRLTQSI